MKQWEHLDQCSQQVIHHSSLSTSRNNQLTKLPVLDSEYVNRQSKEIMDIDTVKVTNHELCTHHERILKYNSSLSFLFQ